jgi:hypothetical protein
MSPEPRRLRHAALAALAILLAGVAWWSTGRLLRGEAPLVSARSAYDREAWEEAASRAREALRAAPSSTDAARLLARSSARLGRDDLALTLLGRFGPDDLEAEDHFLLARILARRDQPAAARAQLWKAHDKAPSHGEVLNDLIRGLAREDALAKAVELAVALRDVPGWGVRGGITLGVLRASQDDPAAAAAALEAALNVGPGREDALVSVAAVRKLLARHRLALGQPDRARAALGTLDDSEARWLLARAALQEGKPCEDRPAPSRDPLAPEPSPYVGTARCAPCHAAIAREYRDSYHARTYWAGATLAGLPLPDRPVADPANSGVVHALRREGDATRVESRVEGRTYRAVIAYAFGSGDRGLTPVCRDEAGRWRELRVSRYAEGPVWDVTTGHPKVPAAPADWLGMALSEDELRRCIDCHTTAPRVARADAGALAHDRGIGCEQCHGPGGNHLKAVAAGLADPAIAPTEVVRGEPIVRLCGHCHSPRARAVSPSDPGSIRFQSTTLTWSRCYTRSDDRLDCVTCHDPHRNAETSRAFYESKCLDCHGSKATTRCPVNPSRDCIACHMPTRRGALPHISLTDHHIRVHPPSR